MNPARQIAAILAADAEWTSYTLDAVAGVLERAGMLSRDAEGMACIPPRDRVYACAACGCLRVEWESWTDPNRDDKAGDSCGDDHWCPDCGDTAAQVVTLERAGSQWYRDRPRFSGDVTLYPNLRAAIRGATRRGYAR